MISMVLTIRELKYLAFLRDVKINNIDVNIKFFVVPDEMMSSTALLGGVLHPIRQSSRLIERLRSCETKLIYQLTRIILPNRFYIDCTDQLLNEPNLNISIPYKTITSLKDLYEIYIWIRRSIWRKTFRKWQYMLKAWTTKQLSRADWRMPTN